MERAVDFAVLSAEEDRTPLVSSLCDAVEETWDEGLYPLVVVDRPWSRHNPLLRGEFARAAQLNHNYVEAWFNLGRSALSLGNLDEAISALQTAVTLRPNLAPAVQSLEQARRLKQARGY